MVTQVSSSVCESVMKSVLSWRYGYTIVKLSLCVFINVGFLPVTATLVNLSIG